jgi:4-hydroxy-tetrahydrodipicolinate synthase
MAGLQGSLVAIVTPMHEDGALDLDAFRRLIDWHIKEGTDGIVVVGTTGESPTVDFDEHRLLIKTAVDQVAGRVPVVAAEAVSIPHILYNGPGRTVADLQNDTVLRLAQIPNIIGIKDATANLERGSDLIRRKPREFRVVSGDDATCLALTLMGGHGVISVTANVAPRLMHDMCAAALSGDAAKARDLNNRLLPLHRNLFLEANPIPVKWAVQQMGLIGGGIRLPLTPLSAACHEQVREAMRHAGARLEARGGQYATA